MNYFLRKNNWKTVKDHIKQTEDCPFFDFEYELEAIFKSYMCSLTDTEVWIDILNEAYLSNKFNMSPTESKQLLKTYAFRPIELIVKNNSLSDFEKERHIRNTLLSWKPYRHDKAFYTDFCQFTLRNWIDFLKMFPEWIDNGTTPIRMIERIQNNPMENSNGGYSFEILNYNRFPYENIVFKNMSGAPVPLSTNMIEGYFHPYSHFEQDKFWFKNCTPYYLYDTKNEVLQEKRFAIDSLLQCPWNCCHRNLKERLVHFLLSKTPSEYRYIEKIIKYDGKQSVYKIIEKYFNLLGRLSPHFPLSTLHESFKLKLQKNILNLDRIEDTPKQVLFPEYYFQKPSVQKELDSLWEETKAHFMEESRHFMLEEFYMVFFPQQIPKEYKSVDMDLTFYIEAQHLFEYISKHKRFFKFINLDALYCKKKENEPKSTMKQYAVREMEKYLERLTSQEK